MPYCCVPYCKSKRPNKLGIGFHEFPMDHTLRQAWLEAIPVKNFAINDESGRQCLVCSVHFLESDYAHNTKQRRLKRTAVPSVFPSLEDLKQAVSTKHRKVELKKPPCSPFKTENSLSALNSGSEEKSLPAAGCQGNSCPPLTPSSPLNTSFGNGLLDSNSGGGAEMKSAQEPKSQNTAAVKVESASEATDDIVPCKRSDVKAIKRLRMQLHKKIDEIRRLRKENKCLKKEAQ